MFSSSACGPAASVLFPLLIVFVGIVRGIEETFALRNTNTEDASTSTDPTDFGWVKNWAAVGDSFTAGIGAGNVYSLSTGDTSCSRYDSSYPVQMNQYFGSTVSSFSFAACSGATTAEIATQIAGLSTGLDLAVLTAGGNDLCLTTIIWNCILSAVTTESTCSSSISNAQTAIDNVLQSNIQDLLTALDAKMNTNGIIVLGSYAQYFNTQTDECTNTQNWVWPVPATAASLQLTQARRTAFNTLVANTNAKLQAAVNQVAPSAKSRIVFASWDAWGPATNGQFCEPGSSGNPLDPGNANVLFYKLNTAIGNHSELKRDLDLWEAPESYVSNIAAAAAEAETRQGRFDVSMAGIHHNRTLMDRAPIPANCGSSMFSGWLPDSIGKIFHPNELGHNAIASFMLFTIMDARAKILNVPSPACQQAPSANTLTCNGKQGSKNYASAYSMYSNVAKFCNYENAQWRPQSGGWSWSHQTYDEGTLDEHSFTINVTDTGSIKSFDLAGCNQAFNTILDGCDGNDPNNPMNWKFGGEYVNGPWTYSLSPANKNRVQPPPTAPTVDCQGWYKVFYQTYTLRGAGWATWDWGQKSLLTNTSRCIGSTPTAWKFTYFDEPDSDGYEWVATFNTPIGTRLVCFNNNKVLGGAGGPTSGGCRGNG